MKYIVLSISFLTISLSGLWAQTSKDILDKLSAKAKTWKTVSADFSTTLSDPKTNTTRKQEGAVKVKGQKYALSLPDYVVISDGVTQWSYSKKENECTIDNVEDVADDSFDPSQMFTIWEKDFRHEMKNVAANEEGIPCYQIQLYPIVPKDKPYHTIVMYVDKAKMEAFKLVVKQRDGQEMSYRMRNLKTNTEFPDTDFQFNKSKYPGVSVTDNRI